MDQSTSKTLPPVVQEAVDRAADVVKSSGLPAHVVEWVADHVTLYVDLIHVQYSNLPEEGRSTFTEAVLGLLSYRQEMAENYINLLGPEEVVQFIRQLAVSTAVDPRKNLDVVRSSSLTTSCKDLIRDKAGELDDHVVKDMKMIGPRVTRVMLDSLRILLTSFSSVLWARGN